MLEVNKETQETLAQLTWECRKGESGVYDGVKLTYQGCGVIEPYYITRYNKYVRATCPCERDAKQKYEQAKEKREIDEVAIKQCYQYSHSKLALKRFENFDASRQLEAYTLAQAFLEIRRGTFILHGSFGTGKTHLLAALCNARREKGKHSLFVNTSKMFAAIQERIRLHESYTDIISKAVVTPLLVLDDIDKAKYSEFREEIYLAIMDDRVLTERPTALSTNRLAELANYVGGACASRFNVGRIAVEMAGEDYRVEL